MSLHSVGETQVSPAKVSFDAWFDQLERQRPQGPSTHLMTGVTLELESADERRHWSALEQEHAEVAGRWSEFQAEMESDPPASELQELLLRGRKLLASSSWEPLPTSFRENLADATESMEQKESLASVFEAFESHEAKTVNEAETHGEQTTEGGESLEISLSEPAVSKEPSFWGEGKQTKSLSSWWGGALVVGVGVFLLVAVRLPSLKRYSTKMVESRSDFTRPFLQVRPKGSGRKAVEPQKESLRFQVWLRQQKKISLAPSQMTIRPGDELRFRFSNTSPEKLFVFVFLVDTQGKLSTLYPSKEEGEYRLPQTLDDYLPGGAVLTSIQDQEKLFVCVSKNNLSHQRVQEFFLDTLKKKKLDDISRLPYRCVWQKAWSLREASP
ncbi:MAG: hypothetical protein H6728_00325 [Myxococcales bacterium]|nr:hypothetical protein [Myxococcales bacterium]